MHRKNTHLNSTSMPLVVILLCTYNGNCFLAEQLDSLETQTYSNWVVVASDDGSTDQTLETLRSYQDKWPTGKLTIRKGPKSGFCSNFMSLTCNSNIKGDYYAFCDQDDVWLPTKLSVAIENILVNQIKQVPYVYCGRTHYVNYQLKPCGSSPLFTFPRTFRNALVQSIAGGNTMVFNQATKSLIEMAGVLEVVSHDWWLYLLVSGAEGNVFYDPVPQLLYRQHEHALVGGNDSLLSKSRRILYLLQGRFHKWNTLNINALMQINHLLAKNNQEILKMFYLLRGAGLKDRFRLLEVCGIYRQTRRGTLSLFLAALLKKI